MLSRDFREFIASLNENGVKYLVVGGYAVALHGYPRYTKDLDIWIKRSEDNAGRIIQALEDFGFGSLSLYPSDFLARDQIIQLGYPPNRIDILTTLKDLEFDECYESRVQIEIQGVELFFVDIENLKRNKRATGRSQDLADAENLSE